MLFLEEPADGALRLTHSTVAHLIVTKMKGKTQNSCNNIICTIIRIILYKINNSYLSFPFLPIHSQNTPGHTYNTFNHSLMITQVSQHLEMVVYIFPVYTSSSISAHDVRLLK